MIKNITLKNNLNVTLNCSVSVEGFHINAQYGNKSVGMCQFHIFKVFAQKMNDMKRALYSKMHKIPLENCPENLELKIDVFGCDNRVEQNFPTENISNKEDPEYSIENDILTFNGGGTYNYSHSTCELLRIEVLDEQFSQVGLGYQMLKFMEEIANMFDAEKITGQFIPNGNLFHASMKFYKRNGFEFIKNSNTLMQIEKKLNKTKTNQV